MSITPLRSESSQAEPVRRVGLDIRQEFPIYHQHWERPLAYLDTAASSQKPREVIDRMTRFLSFEYANIHRGAYSLSAAATEEYEGARRAVAKFIGAASERSIVFTKSATEAVNLVAHSFERYFDDGDTILLTQLEHHSNIVPWQLLAARRKINLQYVNILEDASLDVDDFYEKIHRYSPRVIAITHVSNAFGTVVPLDLVVTEAKKIRARVLLDACQSAPHLPLDVEQLGVDFLVFSGHKVYGPTGIGVLYAREELLEEMDPFMGGGSMISSVTTRGSTWAEHPQKFEAGTPPIAEAIALGTAVNFLTRTGMRAIHEHESKLTEMALNLLLNEPSVTVYGPALTEREQSSIVAFTVEGVHPHDFATIADAFNVQVRAGHHCAMPALHALGVRATVRLSLGCYSDASDFDPLIEAIRHSRTVFS